MNIPKRAPHPQKLAEFYSKLGVVFSRSKMDLFHACTQARFRHFLAIKPFEFGFEQLENA